MQVQDFFSSILKIIIKQSIESFILGNQDAIGIRDIFEQPSQVLRKRGSDLLTNVEIKAKVNDGLNRFL